MIGVRQHKINVHGQLVKENFSVREAMNLDIGVHDAKAFGDEAFVVLW
jgi:hypothetical protein